jgi:hypothetical protein
VRTLLTWVWSKTVTATPGDAMIYFQPNLAINESGQVALCAFALANGRVDRVVLFSPPRDLRFGTPQRVAVVAITQVPS